MVLIYHAFLLTKAAKDLPSQPLANEDEEKKKRKRFLIVLAGEGIGIFPNYPDRYNYGQYFVTAESFSLI